MIDTRIFADPGQKNKLSPLHILLQKAVEVKDGDTPEILQRRVMEEAEWVILPQAIQMIANS